MTTPITIDTANDLVHSDLSQMQRWLDGVLSAEIGEPPNFNWRGLGEILTTRVTANPPLVGLQWAYLAVRVYDHVLETANARNRVSLENSQMNVRSYMIDHLGSMPNDPVLDAQALVRWFFDRLPMPFAEAAPQIDDWPKRDIAWIYQLRQIKNRLSIVMPLYQNGVVGDAELSKWLAVYGKLP